MSMRICAVAIAAGGLSFMVAAPAPAQSPAPASAPSGETLFQQCAVCHSLQDGKNGVGPSLHGMFDAPIGKTPGFRFSNVMRAQTGKWTDELLNKFLADPQATFRGTRMPFSGMPDPAERTALIAYLHQATE